MNGETLLKIIGVMDMTDQGVRDAGGMVLRHCAASPQGDATAERAASRFFDRCVRASLHWMSLGKDGALTRFYRTLDAVIRTNTVVSAPLDHLNAESRLVAKLQVLLTIAAFYKTDENFGRLVARLASDRHVRWRRALGVICESKSALTLAEITNAAFAGAVSEAGETVGQTQKSSASHALKAMTAIGLIGRNGSGQKVTWQATPTGHRVHLAFAKGRHHLSPATKEKQEKANDAIQAAIKEAAAIKARAKAIHLKAEAELAVAKSLMATAEAAIVTSEQPHRRGFGGSTPGWMENAMEFDPQLKPISTKEELMNGIFNSTEVIVDYGVAAIAGVEGLPTILNRKNARPVRVSTVKGPFKSGTSRGVR